MKEEVEEQPVEKGIIVKVSEGAYQAIESGFWRIKEAYLSYKNSVNDAEEDHSEALRVQREVSIKVNAEIRVKLELKSDRARDIPQRV